MRVGTVISLRVNGKMWRAEASREPRGEREKVDRAYGIHAVCCPVYRSLHRAIDIPTKLDWREEGS